MRLQLLVGLMVVISTVPAIAEKKTVVASTNDPEFPGGGPQRPIPTPSASPSRNVRIGCFDMTGEQFALYCASLHNPTNPSNSPTRR